MSAVVIEPSRTLDVSRYGESVPLTSWWSRDATTASEMRPSATAAFIAAAISARPRASAYRMRACVPTTILLSPADFTHSKLSAYCARVSGWQSASACRRSMVSAAMRSVVARSFGSFDAHTQRKGPKPSEKMSPIIASMYLHHAP